jgi:hypothetical protein
MGPQLVEDMMQEVDNSMWERLQDADRVLQELDREERSAHHATCVMDLADRASEVLDRTRWSNQDCTGFCKELD